MRLSERGLHIPDCLIVTVFEQGDLLRVVFVIPGISITRHCRSYAKRLWQRRS